MKLFVCVLSQFALLAAAAVPHTFTGVITDSMCVTDHKSMHISPNEKCIEDCIKAEKSTKYVLFDGKNAYRLNDQETPAQFAGKRVKITGTLYQKTGIIKVDRIEPSR